MLAARHAGLETATGEGRMQWHTMTYQCCYFPFTVSSLLVLRCISTYYNMIISAMRLLFDRAPLRV